MNKQDARKFVKAFASYSSQRDAERGMAIARRTMVRRLADARKLLGVEFDQILTASKVALPKAVLSDEERGNHVVSRNPAAIGEKRRQRVQEQADVREQVESSRTEQLCSALKSGDKSVVAEHLKDAEIRRLRDQLKLLTDATLTDTKVREVIFGLANAPQKVPTWLEGLEGLGESAESVPGVPILFGSDWHWGEVVNPNEIGGVNKYNMQIGYKRAHLMVETAIDLLINHMVNPVYPGIVFALGGDMVSGNIHEELSETNEEPIMPVVLDLINVLHAIILRLKAVFGKVFLPCVSGNHGRNTKKVRAKQFNHNSFDWLIYQTLAGRFKDDPDVTFFIPEGTDALVEIAGHRYLFTHGNQFRGGDGMIGPLGPIIRGDHKKRSRNSQVDQEYDTLVIGHFHQLIQMKRVIVNGSLIGYNEYAFANNFGYEPPQQALWLTHPRHGITMSMPVNLGEDHGKKGRNGMNSPWVSWHNQTDKTTPLLGRNA